MTPDEILAVIRERVKKWRSTGCNNYSPVQVVVDDLDPDRIDAAGRLKEELAKDVGDCKCASACGPCLRMADALLKKGWRK